MLNLEICRKCPYWKESIISYRDEELISIGCIFIQDYYNLCATIDGASHVMIRNLMRKNGRKSWIGGKSKLYGKAIAYARRQYDELLVLATVHAIPERCRFHMEQTMEELNR